MKHTSSRLFDVVSPWPAATLVSASTFTWQKSGHAFAVQK